MGLPAIICSVCVPIMGVFYRRGPPQMSWSYTPEPAATTGMCRLMPCRWWRSVPLFTQEARYRDPSPADVDHGIAIRRATVGPVQTAFASVRHHHTPEKLHRFSTWCFQSSPYARVAMLPPSLVMSFTVAARLMRPPTSLHRAAPRHQPASTAASAWSSSESNKSSPCPP